MADILENEGSNDDMFDSVVMLEQKVAADGFREGFEKGQQQGTEDGYRLGHSHGLNIGIELGFYRGMASTWLEVSSNSSDICSDKAVTSLKKLIEVLEQFPTTVTENMDVNAEMDKVKAVYRKTCSLLKIELSIPVTTKLNF